jgi:septum formation protein
MFSIPFEVIVSHFDEDAHPFHGNPSQYVCELSREKSLAIKAPHPDSLILTADTAVYRDGAIYNKPKERDDARRILRALNGKTHTVYTGVTLRQGDRMETQFAATDVEFDTLTDEELEIYLDKVDWKDKAGAYAIQGRGALLVKGIKGCYYNVKGLPLQPLKLLLLAYGVDIWRELIPS